MKFLKLVFNRVILVLLALLVEIGFIFISLYEINNTRAIRIIATIIGVLVYLHLLNKRQNPEFKIPWLIAFSVFPVFAFVLYILISNNRPNRKQRKMFAKINAEKKKYLIKQNEEHEQVQENLSESQLAIEEYLENTTNMPGTMGNKTTFFNVGEKFFDALLSDLKNAKSFIFMEYFIIDSGYMWDEIHKVLVEKVQEGVEVRIMYDDIGTATKISRKFHKNLRKEGIACCKFNPFVPIISGIHNNRDHRKITVIDGQIGYTGGINIADEYINKKQPFGHWKDSGVKIEGPAVKNFTLLFLEMFDVSQNKLSDYKKYVNIPYKHFEDGGFVLPFGCGPSPYDKEQVGENNFINMIASAKHSIYITTPYLIVDNNLTMTLRNAALKGVDVRIVTPHIPDKKIVFGMTRSSYKYLMEAGVKIYEYTPGFIHSKQMLVDETIAFVGTINYDYRSLIHHYECGAVVIDNNCSQSIKKDFINLFKKSNKQSLETLKISKFTQFINSILSMFRPLF